MPASPLPPISLLLRSKSLFEPFILSSAGDVAHLHIQSQLFELKSLFFELEKNIIRDMFFMSIHLPFVKHMFPSLIVSLAIREAYVREDLLIQLTRQNIAMFAGMGSSHRSVTLDITCPWNVLNFDFLEPLALFLNFRNYPKYLSLTPFLLS